MEKVTINLQDVSQGRDKKRSAIYGARHIAVKILNRYDRSDSYIDKLLMSELNRNDLIQADKALLTEIVNGVIRWRSKLDWVLTGFYHGEYAKCLNLVKNAMRVSLYQILMLTKIPIHAAIDESVEIVKHIQGEKAAGLVNGVLRNIARNIANIRYPNPEDDYNHYLGVIYSHPKWMVKRWLVKFGEEGAIALMEKNNVRPGVPIRINRFKSSPEEVKSIFNEKNIPFTPNELSENAFELKSINLDVSQSELFKSGKITVQDISATFAATLCQAKPDMYLLDLCAAPGGKTFVIAEQMENKGKILAVDKYSAKLEVLQNSAKRMGFDIIKTLNIDGKELRDQNQFDIVLLDAPCSGLGTLAKKPDIKWKRELEDVHDMVKTQKELIQVAAKALKKGGVLVYSTCSIEDEENQGIINWFLENNKDFTLDDASKYLPESICKDGFMQTLPHIHNSDGAFAARLIKN